MKRILVAGLTGLALCGPAMALDPREAEAVVAILETLAYERGESVYMDAAEDWFEFDRNGFGLITGAGFSLQSWTQAYDETLLGFAGGIAQAEIDAQIAQAEAGVAASPLSAEQKAVILADFMTQMDEVREATMQGQQYASVVAPVRGRLQVLMEGF